MSDPPAVDLTVVRLNQLQDRVVALAIECSKLRRSPVSVLAERGDVWAAFLEADGRPRLRLVRGGDDA